MSRARTRHGATGTRFSIATGVTLAFLAFVFLLGGGSRSDIASLPWLRGGALLFAFWAATRMEGADWRRIRIPLTLLLALTIWTALQLVPLPPGVWHGLPGRETIVEIDRLLGLSDLWRPLSLAPSQTMNSLLGMTVPLAALLLVALVPPDEYPDLLFGLVAIACFSALLGIVQILSGATSPAYLYRITNSFNMVGLFANRNNHAVFLACIVLLVAALLRDELMRKRRRARVWGGLIFAGILLTAMTIFIGSRAGFAAGVVAFAIGYAMVVRAWRGDAVDRSGDRSGARAHGRPAPASLARRLLLFSPPVLLFALLGAAFWLTDRATALSRLAEKDIADDLRFQAWPTVQSMVETYWLWGSGQGSFDGAYRMVEPDHLLQPGYFNHAHNDWVELLITGGLPFALIVLAALFWVAKAVLRGGTRNLVKGHRGDLRLPVLGVLLILAMASYFEYPLRVPSLQVLAVLLLVLLRCPKPANMRGDST